jgi:hypothetical protein
MQAGIDTKSINLSGFFYFFNTTQVTATELAWTALRVL